MEIGFNAGHSELFLKHTSAHVTFDLGDHPYVSHAKEYIDAWRLYPSVLENMMLFLLMAITSADLQNAKKLARKNTIVMDDTMYTAAYTMGPTQVWLESDRIMGRRKGNVMGKI